jgi:hypothetical protein
MSSTGFPKCPKNDVLFTNVAIFPLPWVRKSGQASSEDLLPLGYGERERARVRVKIH